MGGVLGGIIGANSSASSSAAATADSNNANQILQQLQTAPDISKPLILQQYQQAGVLTPEMESAINAQMPGLIKTNAADQQAQNQALQQLQQRSTSGLTAADRAALTQANLQSETATQGQLGSIQQQMQQQGLADSGSSLAAKLAAAQGGQNQLSQNANNVAQQSQQAAMAATNQLGQLGGQMEAQDFGQQFQQQQAQQQMQRFNIQNQLGVQQQNTQAANQAQAANLANQQQLSNQNVSQNNANQQYNNQMQQQQWQDNTQLGQIKAGGLNNLAGVNSNLASNAAQQGANIGAGIGAIANPALAGAFSNALGVKNSTNTQQAFAQGGQVQNFKQGGTVPGQANVPGDSPKNDTVHALLSPQEIVVPRSLADSKLGKQLVKLIHAHNSVKGHLNQED